MTTTSAISIGAHGAVGNGGAVPVSASPMGAALRSVSRANGGNPLAPLRFGGRWQAPRRSAPLQTYQRRSQRAAPAGGLPYPYAVGRENGLPRTRDLIATLAQVHANCRPLPGESSCSAPRGTFDFPERTAFLQRLETFSSEQQEHAPATASGRLNFNQLLSLLRASPAAPKNSFVAGTLPDTPELRRLLCLLAEYRCGRAAAGQAIDPIFARERIAELALAVFAPNDAANGAVIGDFDFMMLALLGFPASQVQAVLAEELAQHRRNGPLKPETAAWAAGLILSRLHPPLARTDIPLNVTFGGLPYAKLHFGIDLLHAVGLDHAQFSWPQLTRMADTAMAGAKMNPEFAAALLQLQIPAALWFAHARGAIDLQTQALRDEGTAQRALELLDGAQTKARRAEWEILEQAIAAMQAPSRTPETIALEELQRLGLDPAERHRIPWYCTKWRPADCNKEMRFDDAYLSGCKEIIEHQTRLRLRPLKELVDAHRADIATRRHARLAEVLRIALEASTAQTQEDWRGEEFEILVPMVEKKSLTGGQVLDVQWVHAKTGVIVAATVKGETRHYVISPHHEGFIQPIALAAAEIGLKQARQEYIARTLTDHFSAAGLACVTLPGAARCTAVEFDQPLYSSVPDYGHKHTAEASPGHQVEVPDFSNTKLSLAQRLLKVAQQIDANEYVVLYALEKAALRSLRFSSCFAATDFGQLFRDLRRCGLELTLDDRARLHRDPQLYHADIRKLLLTANLDAAASARAATGFIDGLPAAPAHGPGARPQTLAAILGRTSAAATIESAASGAHANHHRLESGRRLPPAFAATLRGMLASDPSLDQIAAALAGAIRHRKSSSAPSMTPVFSSTATGNAFGESILRFALPGVSRAAGVYAPAMEAQGIFTFELDGNYYQADLRQAYPRLLSVDRIQWEKDHAAICREERALKEGKKKICLTTHTVQIGGDGGDVVDAVDGGGNECNECNEWQVLQARSAAATTYIQSAPIEGREVQIPRPATTMFRNRHQGVFASRRGLAIIDQLFFEDNPNARAAGASNSPDSPVLGQYESLGARAAAGQGIPPIAPLPHSMPGQVIFNGPDQRPMIRYRLSSLDSEIPAAIEQSLTGSRLHTDIQRDFLSLPASELGPARGLVEIADQVFYRFDLPRARDAGWAPVNLVRMDSVADAAEIAAFTSQETTEHWMRTRNFSVDISQAHANFYIDIVRDSDARALTLDALQQEIANQRRFGEHSTVAADALSRCMAPASAQGDATEPPPEEVRQALSLAMSAIARSPELTRRWRDSLFDAFSTPRPHSSLNRNMHFERIYIAPAVPSRVGVLAFLDHELRRTLGLFSEIYEGLDFSGVFDGPALEESWFPAGAENPRLKAIHKIFADFFGARRNVAIAVATLRSGEKIIYHALSGTGKRPALTSRAARNPQAYVYVDKHGKVVKPLPCRSNLTPLYTVQDREPDTEQLVMNRVLEDHQDEIRDMDESSPGAGARGAAAAQAANPNALVHLEFISLLEYCHSCAAAVIYASRQLPHAEFVFADFPPMLKSPPALARTSPRPLRATAAPATRAPVHA
ncbi:MAG TPA: hypothetical protein VGN04_09435 [Herbaspirillum sp.]